MLWSLSPASLRALPRHVCIIEIKGDQYRCLNLPLYTTRPFVISDITLSEHVDAGVPQMTETVEQLLTEQIENMLESVNGQHATHASGQALWKSALAGHLSHVPLSPLCFFRCVPSAEPKYSNLDRPSLPLIRVRVEHTGFARLNVSKFGQSFVNRVANPDDLLHFYKQRQPTARRERGDKTPLDLSSLEQAAGRRGADDDVPGIDEILAQLMDRTPLSLLSETLLADAIEEYVDKRSTEVIAEAVGRSLRDAQKELTADEQVREKGANLTPDHVMQLAKKRHDDIRAKQRTDQPNRAKREGDRDALEGMDERQLRAIGIKQQGDDEEQEEEKPRGRAGAGRGGRAPAANKGRGRGGAAAAGRASRAGEGSSRQRSKVERRSDDDEDEQYEEAGGRGGVSHVDDFGGDVDDGEMEWGEDRDDEKQPTSSRRRQAVAAQPRGQRGGRAARRSEMEDEERNESDELGDVSPAPKRSRVKAEPAGRVAVGGRNRGGELNFLAQAAGRGRQARGGGRAAPQERAAGGRANAHPDGDVVDLIEDD